MAFDSAARRAIEFLAPFYQAKRIWSGHTRPAREREERRARFYRTFWQDAADSLSGTTEWLNESILEIASGGVRVQVSTSYTPLDSPTALMVAADKALVDRLLAERGLPIPSHRRCRFDEFAKAWDFKMGGEGPVVVKPARGTGGGKGVSAGINTRRELACSMAMAGAYCRDVLIERQVQGNAYRLLYLDGKLLDAVVRSTPVVVGDGVATIRALMARDGSEKDRRLRRILRTQGFRLGSVPPAGRTVQVGSLVKDQGNQYERAVTDQLCPSLVKACAAAAEAVGLRLAGVDVMTVDPSVPLEECGGAIIEVNSTPGLHHHQSSPAVSAMGTAILQAMFSCRK